MLFLSHTGNPTVPIWRIAFLSIPLHGSTHSHRSDSLHLLCSLHTIQKPLFPQPPALVKIQSLSDPFLCFLQPKPANNRITCEFKLTVYAKQIWQQGTQSSVISVRQSQSQNQGQAEDGFNESYR